MMTIKHSTSRPLDVMNPGKRLRSFTVYHKGYFMDRVFYSSRDMITADEVKRSLVNHDGYPFSIEVIED